MGSKESRWFNLRGGCPLCFRFHPGWCSSRGWGLWIPSDVAWFLFRVFLVVWNIVWLVVSKIFYFHPYLGKWSNLTNIFQGGWNHQLVFPAGGKHPWENSRLENQTTCTSLTRKLVRQRGGGQFFCFRECFVVGGLKCLAGKLFVMNRYDMIVVFLKMEGKGLKWEFRGEGI